MPVAASPHGPAPASPPPRAARTRLLLEAPIIPTLTRIGLPNVVVNVVLIAVSAAVDAHFVGRLGASALAGVVLVFPFVMLMQQLANASMGGAIVSAISRAIGAGREKDARALATHSLLVALGMAAIFSVAFLVGGARLYTLMGGSGAALEAAVQYSTVVFAGAVAYWLLSTLTSIVRGTGQAALLAGVYILSELVHLGLVPLLVFGWGPVPALGVSGAGLATVIAFSLSTAILAGCLRSRSSVLRLTFRDVRLEARLFKEILRVGAPMSLGPAINNGVLAVVTGFAAGLGPAALAGFGAAVRLEYLQIPLVFGFGAGVIAMVGTNLGAGKIARALRISWVASGLAVAATATIAAAALTVPKIWIALFSRDPGVIAAGTTYLQIVSFSYPFVGLGLMLNFAFQGAGRPLWPVVATATRALIVAALGWLVIREAGGGLMALAVVASLGGAVYGLMQAVAFRWSTVHAKTP